jgi:flagellar assembly protein FliH
MNTLSDLVWQEPSGERVQSFPYPAMQPGFGGADPAPASGAPGQKSREQARQLELTAAVEAAREKGFREGQAQAAVAATKAVEQERAAVAAAVQDFAEQRAKYFRKVETEAVRLALSIARKVLHREADMDPLLLAGVVRVALDQMQAGSHVSLRTSAASASAWSAFCKEQYPKLELEVLPDAAIPGHRCLLQAEVGTTEISLEGQLREIESGFFDLLRANPEAT